MTENRDDLIADLITQLANDPRLARPEGVTPAEWRSATTLAGIERELRRGVEEAPPLEQDRVAAMLGLIPDESVQLDRARLTRLRRRAGLSAGQLAGRLAERGWEITQRDIFRWENSGAHDVPPAVIEAIASSVGASASDLVVTRAQSASVLDIRRADVRALGERLAVALGIGQDMALSRLRTAAAGSFHRGVRPKDEELLATLESFVRALERRNGS